MISRRTTEILIAAASVEPDPAQLLAAVCQQAARELKCVSVTVSYVTHANPLMTVASSDDVGAQLDTVQSDLGEGPSCLTAAQADSVGCDDLHQHRERWPIFAQAALERGVGAVFVFPIAPDDTLIASLSLYRNPGELNEADEAAAVDYAGAVSLILLHTEQIEPNGGVQHNPGAPRWVVVQQAIGMVSVQLNVSLSDAHARLRARAYSEGVPLSALATDVVQRKLRFTNDDTSSSDNSSSNDNSRSKHNQEEQ